MILLPQSVVKDTFSQQLDPHWFDKISHAVALIPSVKVVDENQQELEELHPRIRSISWQIS